MPAVKVFGTVVDKRTLTKFSTFLGGGVTSVVATLISIGHVGQHPDETRYLNVSEVQSCDCA